MGGGVSEVGERLPPDAACTAVAITVLSVSRSAEVSWFEQRWQGKVIGLAQRFAKACCSRKDGLVKRTMIPWALVGGAGAFVGCNEGPVCCAPPPVGTLLVTTVTTGVNLDPDGYTVVATPQISGRDSLSRAVGVNATLTWDLEPVTHSVRLTGVQSNCVPTGDNPRLVTIVVGDTVLTTFEVSCST